MGSDDEVLALAKRLRIAGNAVTRTRDRNASLAGLTSGQADALWSVSRSPGCRIADLRERMGGSHQAACAMADRLEAKGLLSSERDGRDARARSLRVTEEGQKALDLYLRTGIEANRALFEGLSDEEIAVLGGYLERILANLGGERPAPARSHRRPWSKD